MQDGETKTNQDVDAYNTVDPVGCCCTGKYVLQHDVARVRKEHKAHCRRQELKTDSVERRNLDIGGQHPHEAAQGRKGHHPHPSCAALCNLETDGYETDSNKNKKYGVRPKAMSYERRYHCEAYGAGQNCEIPLAGEFPNERPYEIYQRHKLPTAVKQQSESQGIFIYRIGKECISSWS
jgi:hypothetical protein